ncbi:hypothetical protein JKF63_01745 [Porcisia hertigi]|uniref:Sfi1 spindle body domain-containing protein n=1 Tax=Porcisia hertigi TaxID=2761500 RepID=A0A836LB44_9TRYP|nr:hypothetical protein JKF63_01745 [Porcisia hertigi]
MRSGSDESAFLTLSTDPPVAALQGACAVVYEAVCAEAIRLIFSLYALSQSGVVELGDELHRCREFISESECCPPVDSEPVTPPCHVRSFSLFQRTPSHEGAHFKPRSHQGMGESHGLTSAEARECITNASIYGLLTAAHLLRCSTWTAASLVPASLMDRHSAPTHASQLLTDARAAEELRTRESGWCATALVTFTEWLLLSFSSNPPPFLGSTLPSRALSTTEMEFAPTDGRDSFLLGVPPESADNDDNDANALRAVSMPAARQCRVFVVDSLPLYFSFLGTGKGHRQSSAPSPWGGSPRVANTSEKGCVHRWLLDDLPRWCAQVALNEQSKLWYHTYLLRHTLERWRARRGLRVVAHLSNAVDALPEVKSHPSALTAQIRNPSTDLRMPSFAGLGKGMEEDRRLFSRPNDASEAVTLPQAVSTQTPAEPPKPGNVDGQFSGVHSTVCFREVLAHDASMIAPETEPLSSIQSQDGPHSASTPTVTVLADRDPADAAASASMTCQLDNVLRGVARTRDSSSPGMDSEEKPGNVREGCEEEPHQRHRGSPLRQGHGNAVESLFASARASTSPSEREFTVDPSPTTASDNRTASSMIPLPHREERQEELVRDMVRRRRNAVARQVFSYWRDHRLYEALAARFLLTQRREATRAHCWAQWKRRQATTLQRDKEASDLARCDAYTAKNALQYFRGLLQRWKMAALARHFLLSTLGHRALRAWECNTRFVQAQRATPQPLIGARLVKWQVWTQWLHRRHESTADRFHARKRGAATLLLMKEACMRREALRLAMMQANALIARRAFQRWTWKRTIATRLNRFVEARLPQRTLVREAWENWRSRWRERQMRREREPQIRAFRVAQRAAMCFAQWVQRWRRETYVRACVARQKHRHVLHPAFLHWQQRMQLCVILRQGQEELALKISEQLQGRRVLRTWRRRAAQHVKHRRQLFSAVMVTDAERFWRFNQIARTFFHWRTHSFTIRRYNVDRRRGLPAAAQDAAGMSSLRGNGAVLSITGIIKTESRVEAGAEEEHIENSTDPAAIALLPLPPHSAASSSASPSKSQRGRRRHAGRGFTHVMRSPQRSPARGSSVAATRESASATEAAARGVPHSVGFGDINRDDRVAPTAATHGGLRVAQSRQLAIPHGKRTIALQRQLLAVQGHQRPSLLLAGPRARASRTWLKTTPPAWQARYDPPFSRSSTPRRTATRPRALLLNNTVEPHWHDKKGDDSSEIRALRRSPTATPLSTTCEAKGTPRPPQGAAAPRYTAALVDSPHTSPLPQRQRNGGAHLQAHGDYATLESGCVPTASSHRLLRQMEELLWRIRTIEGGYGAPATGLM